MPGRGSPAVALARGSTRRGIIWNSSLGIQIPFQYHPESFVEEKTVAWETMPILGTPQPLLAYGSGDLRILSFRILLDAHASPHPKGHVEDELRALKMLTIPFDVNRKPTVNVPEHPIASAEYAPRGPGRVSGVPPVVNVYVGGKVYKCVARSVRIEEVLHGTTPQAQATMACTRAWVDLEFIVIEDSRMLVHWRPYQPKAQVPQ